MRLWRAADAGTLRSGMSLSPEETTAEAYRHNPGFGGAQLWSLDTEPQYVLDVRNGDIERVLDLLDADEDLIEDVRSQGYASVGVLLAERSDIERLLSADYDWVIFRDDYPDGAITWWYLGADELTLTQETR